MKIHFMHNPFWNLRNAILWRRLGQALHIWIFSLQISIYPKDRFAHRR